MTNQNDLEQTRIAIRYFLQQITNDNCNALCIIENKGLRWFCGTKNFLSKMTSEGIKNKSSQDVFEELHKSEEEEKLENDEDLFEDLSPQMSQLAHSKWKFIGDCAWLMPTDGTDGNIVVNNTEADGRPSRKRRRSEPKIEASVVKSEEMDEDEIEEDDENMKPFCCNICARGFHSKEELKTHTCTRTHPKPFECDICRKGFSTKSNMQRHRNIHTKEKVFQCNHCSKKFYDSGNLKRHIEGVHNQKEEISKSEDEALQISEENSRSSSIGQMETDLKPIETSVIKKREVKNESSPKKSQNSNSTTSNQSPSSSTVATTSCSSSHNVVELSDEEQMRNHDEERVSPNQILTSLNHTERPHSYTCDRCLLRFDTKEEAIDHLRQSHPGNEQQHCLRVEQPVSKPNEKPFTYKLFYCDFCWKEFTWRANLVRHINIHTHEKIFPCSTCKKTFRYIQNQNSNRN